MHGLIPTPEESAMHHENHRAISAERPALSDSDGTARLAALTDFVIKIGAAHGQYLEPTQAQVEIPSECTLARDSAIVAAFQAIQRLAEES
jgi:hypothetical protein